MRLKKGSNVEVFQSGSSWRPAQILSGNGRNYAVQYADVATPFKVPRKLIRLIPVLKQKLINWVVGDVAEVFIHDTWTNGRVTGVVYGNEFCFVELIDYSREIAVRRNNLRLRHEWKNDKWIVTRKDVERENGASMVDTESIGSCSGRPNNHSHNYDYNYNYTAIKLEETDAMSQTGPTKQSKKNRRENEELENEVHKLELEEYKATMSDLYSSGNGVMTWDQQAMLVGLRVSLHISHEEHRSVLRSLGPK